MCAWGGNQWSRGVVTSRVQTNVVWSLHHQRQDLHQLTYRKFRFSYFVEFVSIVVESCCWLDSCSKF
jgi:hypothetical protein